MIATKTKSAKDEANELAEAITSGGEGLPTRPGTGAPALTVSTEVATVKPVELEATAGPVVNWPAAKVILEAPTGKAAMAVVHTMVSTPADNAQVSVGAVPETGMRTPAGAEFAVK